MSHYHFIHKTAPHVILYEKVLLTYQPVNQAGNNNIVDQTKSITPHRYSHVFTIGNGREHESECHPRSHVRKPSESWREASRWITETFRHRSHQCIFGSQKFYKGRCEICVHLKKNLRLFC